jgi:hypothetical protein
MKEQKRKTKENEETKTKQICFVFHNLLWCWVTVVEEGENL